VNGLPLRRYLAKYGLPHRGQGQLWYHAIAMIAAPVVTKNMSWAERAPSSQAPAFVTIQTPSAVPATRALVR
jgi:hypothetical protein